MAIGTLFNIPRTPEQWNEFAFANFDSHNKIAQAIYRKYTILIPTYPLDPIPWFDFQTWARNHQQSHDQQDGILNIQGSDFTSGDLSREDELANFIRLHGTEHQLAEAMLGVT
jgi:hypothetical protein